MIKNDFDAVVFRLENPPPVWRTWMGMTLISRRRQQIMVAAKYTGLSDDEVVLLIHGIPVEKHWRMLMVPIDWIEKNFPETQLVLEVVKNQALAWMNSGDNQERSFSA